MAQAQQEKGGRRWINSYVDGLAKVIIDTPNLVPTEKSDMLGSLYAMFKILNNLAENYVPLDDNGNIALNLNDERYRRITMGDTQYIVLPVIPAKTLLTSLTQASAQTKQTFDEQNSIQRAPRPATPSTPADDEQL